MTVFIFWLEGRLVTHKLLRSKSSLCYMKASAGLPLQEVQTQNMGTYLVPTSLYCVGIFSLLVWCLIKGGNRGGFWLRVTNTAWPACHGACVSFCVVPALLKMNMFNSSEHPRPHFKHGHTLKSWTAGILSWRQPIFTLHLQTYMHEHRCIISGIY